MRSVFADSFYYLAVVNADDAAHQRALEVSSRLSGSVVTTAWVLTEVADAMAAPEQRREFITLLETLRDDPEVVIVPANEQAFEAGIDLYSHRADKGWSLTDCISFVVMRENAITEALTGDHHFEQAGFIALLK